LLADTLPDSNTQKTFFGQLRKARGTTRFLNPRSKSPRACWTFTPPKENSKSDAEK
jgi:hypothetical protein